MGQFNVQKRKTYIAVVTVTLLLKVARKMSFGESLLSYYIFYMS